MDTDVAAWLTAIAPLDEGDDAFLRALLSTDGPRIGDTSSAFGDRTFGDFGNPGANADDEDENDSDTHTPPSPPSSTSDQHEDARPVKKRKRRSTWRPKEEIERLRRSVADLEGIVAVHAQRPTARQQNADDIKSMTSPACSMWKNVAARQFQRRRDSERENDGLRNRVGKQVAVVKSLMRLVHRAQQGLPSQDVPRTMMPIDMRLFASKRQEMQTTLAMLFDSLDNIPPDSLFRLRDEEFRATQKLTMPSDFNIRPGTLLAQSCEKRFVPSQYANLGDLLWTRGEVVDSEHAGYKAQALERSDRNYFASFSFEFPTIYGHTRYNGVSVRARVRNASRDAIAVVASVWPDATAPTQVQGSGYDLSGSIVMQPHSRSMNLNEVLINIECNRLVPPTSSSQMTQLQAGMLDAMVSSSHKFLLDQNDQFIDSVLLQDLDGLSVS